MKHVDHHQILSDCQHGFPARRSCETQLVTLINDLSSPLNRGDQNRHGDSRLLQGVRPSPTQTASTETPPLRHQRTPA